MIVKEFYRTRSDGVNLYRTYSSDSLKIRKYTFDQMGNKIATDEVYDEALDIEGAPYVYKETDEPIKTKKDNEEF